MKRGLALVEGPTERDFIQELLNAHLRDLGLHLDPVVVMTSRHRSGRKHTGGLTRYPPFQRQLAMLLGDSSAAVITTMVDYYRLPQDFPGQTNRPPGTPIDQTRHLERALEADIDDPRFLPYLSLHEFEALVLATLDDYSKPEEIDGEPETHPSKRLESRFPTYKKTVDGVLWTQKAGLDHLRSRCPHFDEWISKLEEIAQAN